MPYSKWSPNSTECQSACAMDVAPCPSVSEIPAAGNALNGSKFTGFTKTCGPANTVIQTVNYNQGQYRISDYLNIMSQGGTQIYPMFRQMYETHTAVARLLFDWEEYVDPTRQDGKPMTILTMKTPFTNTNQWMPSVDGKSFVYTERKFKRPKAFVIRDETTSNQVLIGLEDGSPLDMTACDKLYKDMFQVDDVVLIKANGGDSDDPDCCSRLVQRSIVAVDTETWDGDTYLRLTFEDQPTANADLLAQSYKGRNGFKTNTTNAALDKNGITYPGDSIERLYKTRNDNDRISGRYNEQSDDVKVTNIQHFFNNIRFTKADLNMSYAIEKEAEGFIKNKINNININFIDEIANAFYFGRNRNQDSAVSRILPDGTVKRLGGETMGVLPALYEAHIANPQMGIIQSGARLRTDDDFCRLFLDQLIAVQESGVLNHGEAVTVVMDSRARSSWVKLQGAWNRLVGQVVTNTNNVTKDFSFPVINTPMGSMEVLTCKRFTELLGNSGNILFLPKKLIAMVQRPNDRFYIDSGSMEKSTPGFKVRDITLPGTIHGHEEQVFDLFGERAIALGLTDSGAWRMIEEFRR